MPARRTTSKKGTGDAVVKRLRAFGLAYPGTHTKSPWPGHMDLAVKDKTFAYLSVEGEPLSVSCKLPQSQGMALLLPFAKPTPYGLGKSGWVTAQFAAGDKPPLDLLQAWLEESYRAQAPKRLVAMMDARKTGGAGTGAASGAKRSTRPAPGPPKKKARP